jgi:antitoxin component HigA of HigAB toxin-antitoxin module
MSYIFEKKKLYNYLGKHLTDTLKEHNAYIAGGCITSLFCNREINDVDIYFKCKEDAGNFIETIISDRGWILSHTNKATAFKYGDKTCQVIHFDYFPEVKDIFSKFDFTVCMGAFDFNQDEFVLHEDFLKHNAQKILKFNENTAYPIISALRVQKYEDKYYTISKPEYIKVLLTCMNLKIDNYEDLKEQMSGMYGVNYDKILEPVKDQEFNLQDIIKSLTDLILDDDYFKAPVKYEFPDDIEDLAYKISGKKIKVVKFDNKYYKFRNHDFEYFIDEKDIKSDLYETVNINTVIGKGTKLYKFVCKKDDKYFSFNDGQFEYKIGEIAVSNSKLGCSSKGIYCGYMQNCDDFSYRHNKGTVLLELEIIDDNDIIDLSNLRIDKVKVIREVPKEEYEKYMI